MLLVVVVTVWAGVAAALAAQHLVSARDSLRGVGVDSVDDPDAAVTALERAREDTSAASGLLGQPGPRLVGAVPFLGRSVDSARALADSVDAAVGAALPLVDAVSAVGVQGGVDLDGLRRLQGALAGGAEATRSPLARLEGTGTSWTPGILDEAVTEAQERLVGLDDVLGRAAAGTDALHRVLGGGGDRTVLIALENNAELRGTGGLVSVFALAETSGGRLVDVRFQQVADLVSDGAPPVRVPAPPEYVAAYGPLLADSTLWQNTTMSPDAPATAQVLAEVSATSAGVRPDDVVLLDVPAMAAIVSATGPLTLPDGSVLAGEDLVEEVLVKAYGDGQFTDDRQNVRRGRLVEIADATFARLTGGLGASPRDDARLVRALGEAAAGRHLMLWSSDAETQASLAEARLDGGLDPRGTVLATATVNNLGDTQGHGNKLDYYVDRSYSVTATVGTERATVTQTVRLTNSAPEGLGPYVQGFTDDATLAELVELALPRDATDVVTTLDGTVLSTPRLAVGEVDQTRAVVIVARGESSEVSLTYTTAVDDGRFRLRVLPQPLARDADLELAVRPADGLVFAGASPDGVTRSEPHARSVTVDVAFPGPTGWAAVTSAVSDFWRSPVPRPW